jgi:pyridinium-3,5-biscarboxylic acid mononucleotide sulfurtransferase
MLRVGVSHYASRITHYADPPIRFTHFPAGRICRIFPFVASCWVIQEKRIRLRSLLGNHAPLLVAYSGGVDSTYLLAEAVSVLGSEVTGVIAESASLPRQAFSSAFETATSFGAKLRVLHTTELEDPQYSSNPLNRCYFCKAELFRRMELLAKSEGFRALAYGENADDSLAVRPGSKAAVEFKVLSPLHEASLSKAEIRQLSRQLGLPTAEKPAQPCLSSRIPHGTQVTLERLALVERAEERLRRFGLQIFRVRLIALPSGQTAAKLQIAPKELTKYQPDLPQLQAEILAAGFDDVSVDPLGYRPPSGLS